MFDRTRAAVTKQLRGMGCDHFEVGVRHADRGMLLREWAASDIPHGIDWLKRENAHGSDIYIRPARGINHGMVLVDDLGIGGVQAEGLIGDVVAAHLVALAAVRLRADGGGDDIDVLTAARRGHRVFCGGGGSHELVAARVSVRGSRHGWLLARGAVVVAP